MKLNIKFDELVSAFENSNWDNHYFVDTNENKLIYINETMDNHQEELEKMEDKRYIPIPKRMPEDNFKIMEFFVYELGETDFELSEKFHEVLEQRNPFRNFKDLLLEHPETREKWFKYKDNYIKNETINWLCEKGIELENQQLIPNIEIMELNQDEIDNLPEEIRDFGPMGCLNCNNEEGLMARFFSLNVPQENVLIEREVKRIIKEKYGINQFGVSSGWENELLTVSKCPKCGSEDIFWDY